MKEKFTGTAFLERVQQLSTQKKVALNSKIKEKILAIGVNNELSNSKTNFHLKNKSEVPKIHDPSQFKKIYTSAGKLNSLKRGERR